MKETKKNREEREKPGMKRKKNRVGYVGKTSAHKSRILKSLTSMDFYGDKCSVEGK